MLVTLQLTDLRRVESSLPDRAWYRRADLHGHCMASETISSAIGIRRHELVLQTGFAPANNAF